MSLPIEAVQQALREEKLDGWLLYDFQGSNPIASRLVGLAGSGKMTTRRWYYFVPAAGAPRGLVHAIESHNLDDLPGDKRVYAGREQLGTGLKDLLNGARTIAMEYSPGNAIPVRLPRRRRNDRNREACGVTVVSSGDLAQRFEAIWSDEAYATHVAASERLYRIKDRAFAMIRQRMAARAALTEIEVQTAMVGWFREEGLVADTPPNVSAQENAGNPHYQATEAVHRAIGPNELVLIDLWGKLPVKGAVYADITWMGFTGTAVPAEIAAAFARGTRRPRRRCRSGADRGPRRPGSSRLRGRSRLPGGHRRAGLGAQFIHRTGHSLGENVHGNGVHMDDYETHDDRRLLPGTGFTIEPGVYTDRYRRPNRDQHVRRRTRGPRHRPAAERNRAARLIQP